MVNFFRKEWNKQKDVGCEDWDSLPKNKQIEFVVENLKNQVESGLQNLEMIIQDQDNSSISITHAMNHIRQKFNF